MTKIVVEELKTTLEQNFTNNVKRKIQSIRIWIYKHLSPSGNFYITVNQASQDLAVSEALTSSYIEANSSSTALNYSHGFIKFNFTNPFILNAGDFTLELSNDSYTFSESAYVGWVKYHENNPFTQDYSPNNGVNNTFGVEFWETRERL
jgi:hypothetical protein